MREATESAQLNLCQSFAIPGKETGLVSSSVLEQKHNLRSVFNMIFP